MIVAQKKPAACTGLSKEFDVRSSSLLLKNLAEGQRHARRGSAARAYIFLDIREGKSIEAAEVMQSMCGVVIADLLEGPPDIVVVVEALDRTELASLINRALASIEALIEGLTLLPVQNYLSVTAAKQPVAQGARKEVKHT